MDLRHLRYFVAVADERNFTRAAEVLNIAQPPLSRQIRQLEMDVGIDLFDRDVRPIRLTDAGRLMYEHASQILASMDRLRSVMRRAAGADRRRFVIGFVGSALYGLLPEAIRRFRKQVGHVDVSLLECSTVEQISALKDGRIDVGFGRLRIEDAAIRRLILSEENLVAAVPADDVLTNKGVAVGLSELAARPLIVYPRPARPSFADQVLAAFQDLGLVPASVIEARELQAAIGLVAAQEGICLVPDSVQRLQRDDIRYLPLEDPVPKSPILMIHREGDVSSELGALIEISRALLGADGARGYG